MRDAVIQHGESVPQESTSHADRLAELKTRRELASLEREVAVLEQSAAMVRRSRAAVAMESWSDLEIVDRRDWMPTGFGLEHGNYLSTQHDREDGRYSPFVENETDLALIRGMARIVTAATCAGIGVQNNLTNYVIGDGFTIEASARKHKISGRADVDEGLISAIQDTIDEFLEENRWWGDLDRELFWRSRRDGEFFLALFPTPTGFSRARVVEPEQVTEPATRLSEQEIFEAFGEYIPHATNWDFGVHTADHDVQTVHGYSVEWERSGYCDYLPKSIVEHYKVNVDRNVKRGMSDFYPAWKWMEQTEKIFRNTGQGAAIQAAIAFIREHAQGVTEGQINTMNAANAEFIRSRRKAGGSYQTENVQQYQPGTVADIPHGMQYKPGPLGHDRGPIFVDIANAILRYTGVRWNMPEWMINGDASNNNLASSITAESPFHRNVEAMQGSMITVHRSVLWRVIRNAAAVDKFSRFGEKGTFEAIKRQIDLQIEPPQIDRREPGEETERRVSLVSAGIMSKKTAQMEEGLDPRQEEENGLSVSQSMNQVTANGEFYSKDELKLFSQQGEEQSSQGQAVPSLQQENNTGQSLPPLSPLEKLNGAQIQAATGIVSQVAKNEIPRDSGLNQLQLFLGLTAGQAEQIMGTVGKGFTPESDKTGNGENESPTSPAAESHADPLFHARQAAVAAALESVETTDEAKAILREVYP